MRLASAIALALFCLPTAALAQEDDSPTSYVGLRGSLAFQGSVHGTANVTPPVSAKANFKTGEGASVFWGIDLPAGFNAELELMYRYLPLKDGVVSGISGISGVPSSFSGPLGGYGEMFAPMANVYWTVPLDLPVRPYIGGGVGYAWNEVGVNSIGTTSFQTLHHDDWRLAYNAMAGFVIPVTDRSRFTIGYRWLHENVGVNCGSGITCSAHMDNHSIDFGYALAL